MKHRLIQTTDILINAFFKGSLTHGEPCSCAVGNLCNGDGNWMGLWNSGSQIIYDTPVTLFRQPTRYYLLELMAIEYAFEGRAKSNREYHWATLFLDNDPDGFKGLTAVFDLLCNEIDRDYFEAEESRVNIFQIYKHGVEKINEPILEGK